MKKLILLLLFSIVCIANISAETISSVFACDDKNRIVVSTAESIPVTEASAAAIAIDVASIDGRLNTVISTHTGIYSGSTTGSKYVRVTDLSTTTATSNAYLLKVSTLSDIIVANTLAISTITSMLNQSGIDISTLSALSAANIRELIGETTNNFRQNQFANVSGSSITIDGNSSVYIATTAPISQAGDLTVNLGTANVVGLLNGGVITISSITAAVLTYGSYLSSNTATAETGTILTGAGVWHGICVNTTAAGSVVIYDNTSGAGKILANFDTSAYHEVYPDFAVSTGITYVKTGTADVSMGYK